MKYDKLKKYAHVMKEQIQAEKEGRHMAKLKRCSGHLDKADICQLDSISLKEEKDFEFITCCIERLYKNNLAVLKEKSLRGKSHTDPNTLARRQNKKLTPTKLGIIYDLHRERVLLSKKNLDARVDLDVVNRKITNALSAIKRKLFNNTDIFETVILNDKI